MILCMSCNTRKRSEHFKIKVKLVNREVIFKICDSCGTTEDLEREEWKNEMLDKGALDFKRPSTPVNVDNMYKTKYDISSVDYNNMYAKQKGRCAICTKHQMDIKRRLVVDHCHTSGKVRSLLCNSCNSALGFIKEDIFSAINLLDYIKKYKHLKNF